MRKTGFTSQKVEGGKLLQAEVQCDDDVIEAVAITGDFFMYPEENVSDLEACFQGLPLSADLAELTRRVKSVVSDKRLTLVGVSAEDIAATVLQSLVQCSV